MVRLILVSSSSEAYIHRPSQHVGAEGNFLVAIAMKEVLFVQGGGRNVHDSWDHRLVASLEQHLGRGYVVRYPRMPDEANPDPATWQKVIAGHLNALVHRGILVAHSVGAAIALDYLAAADTRAKLGAALFIAIPFIGEGGWPSDPLRPTEELAAHLPGGLPLHFYFGSEDPIVPLSHGDLFAKTFPRAHVRVLPGRDHQLGDDLSEVAEDIKGLGSSRGHRP